MSSSKMLGIHHVTAIAGDAQRNVDFYAGMLGLRMVKRTVNFDDPQTYHFYFGDEVGTPGTIMTFFPWPRARRGRQGVGQVAVTSFAILPSAVSFWVERLLRYGIRFEGPTRRGPRGGDAEQVLAFRDHDGLMLELVAHAAAEGRPVWEGAPGIPAEHALRGFHTVTLWEESGDATERVLVDVLGFRPLREEEGVRRYAAGDGGPGALVDVRAVGGFVQAVPGAGTVHHVAWRVPDDDAQQAAREQVIAGGLSPTPVMDRNYFHSVYFREPGGVLFEIATDVPGFAIDEPVEHLGESLKLPAQYEPHRAQIEAVLPTIHLPVAGVTEPPAFANSDAPQEVGGDALGFVHRYIPAIGEGETTRRTTLLMLHGTGGDEDDLIPLGRTLLPGAAILSPRGKVLERGMPRFFRRLAEGVFDVEDLVRRTHELGDFIESAAAAYALDPEEIVAVGFSNGANIASSTLLLRPGLLKRAILLSPMVPFEPDVPPTLDGTSVFIGAGRGDPMTPTGQVERLAEILRQGKAEVTVHWHSGGHTLTADEVEAARGWLTRETAERVEGAGDALWVAREQGRDREA